MRVKGVKQPDSLTQITEEILEQIIKQSICKLLEDNKNNQRGLTKHTSHCSSLMSFWDRITGLARMRREEAATVSGFPSTRCSRRRFREILERVQD